MTTKQHIDIDAFFQKICLRLANRQNAWTVDQISKNQLTKTVKTKLIMKTSCHWNVDRCVRKKDQATSRVGSGNGGANRRQWERNAKKRGWNNLKHGFPGASDENNGRREHAGFAQGSGAWAFRETRVRRPTWRGKPAASATIT